MIIFTSFPLFLSSLHFIVLIQPWGGRVVPRNSGMRGGQCVIPLSQCWIRLFACSNLGVNVLAGRLASIPLLAALDHPGLPTLILDFHFLIPWKLWNFWQVDFFYFCTISSVILADQFCINYLFSCATIFPRSLDPFYVVSYYVKCVKTSLRTYSSSLKIDS